MELDKFHVDQLGTGVIRERVAIAGSLPTVARDLVCPSHSACRQYDGFSFEDTKPAVLAFVSETANDSITIFEESDDRDLHVNLDTLMNAMVLQSTDQFQSGAIADVSESRIAVAPEISL